MEEIMQKIKITIFRERKSLERADVEVEVFPGDFVDNVVGAAELIATDLKLWHDLSLSDYTYAPEEFQRAIASAAAAKQEVQP
jgi:hypothetical protein